MAPKFLRKFKNKIQKFFARKMKYDELAEENFDYIQTVRCESPEELNLTLATKNKVTFEADFRFFNKFESGCWDTNFVENSTVESETDNRAAASCSTENTKTHYVQELYKLWAHCDVFEIAAEESFMMTKNIVMSSDV